MLTMTAAVMATIPQATVNTAKVLDMTGAIADAADAAAADAALHLLHGIFRRL
jgi:hypothetical protein